MTKASQCESLHWIITRRALEILPVIHGEFGNFDLLLKDQCISPENSNILSDQCVKHLSKANKPVI